MTENEKLTPWQKYKKNLGSTRPWDLLNPNMEHVPADIQKARYETCATCPEFFSMTGQCKKCGCFMHLKVKLPMAECPLQKWGPAGSDI